MREEVVKMKETYQYLARGCDHPPLKASSHHEALSVTYTPIFWRRKARQGSPLLSGRTPLFR